VIDVRTATIVARIDRRFIGLSLVGFGLTQERLLH